MACRLIRIPEFIRCFRTSGRTLSQSMIAPATDTGNTRDRGPNEVCRVLTATVSPFSDRQLPSGLSRIDPMAPLSRKESQRCDAARESGQKAAEYVSSRWPASPLPSNTAIHKEKDKKVRGICEEALCRLISKRRTSRALKMFNKLMERGVPVSVESQNMMLDLLAFYGLGTTWVSDSQRKETGSWVDTETGIIQDNPMLAYNNQEKESYRVWSEDCAASKFFNGMTEKNVESYETLIAGMVKFNAVSGALGVYRDMRQAGLQPSVGMYNILISSIDGNTESALQVVIGLLSQMSEGKPPVKPNSQTLTAVVKALTQLDRQNCYIALQLWREITETGVRPTLAGYGTLLGSFMDNGQVGIIYTIVDHLERDPSPLHKISDEGDGQFFRLASTAALELQDVSLAERLFSLSVHGSSGSIGNPSGFFTKLLIIIARFGSVSAFLRHYRQCVPSVFIPPDWAYSNFLLSCKHRGESAEAAYLWNHAVQMNVHISPSFIDQALQAVSSCVPSLVDQDEVFKTMVTILDLMASMQLTPTRNSMGGAVRLYTAVRPFEDVINFVRDCVEKRWSISYWSLCQLLQQCIGRHDVDSLLTVLRVLVSDGYEVKQWHQQQIRQHMALNGEEDKELQELLYQADSNQQSQSVNNELR